MASTGFILPAQADLVAIVGADFSCTIALFSDTAETTPFDLTGYTAALTIGSAFTLTGGSGLTINAAAGTITAALTHAQTASASVTRTGYNLKLTDSSGTVSFPLSGEFAFRAP